MYEGVTTPVLPGITLVALRTLGAGGTLLALQGLDRLRGELVLGDRLVLQLLAGDRVVLDLLAVDQAGSRSRGATDCHEQRQDGDDGGGTKLLDAVNCVLHLSLHSG